MTEPILTTTQIAERADYTREQIWAKARKGEIPAQRANPGGKWVRYFDSPELRAWCKERAGRRARSLARQQANAERSWTLPNRERVTRPWSWTKKHEALLHRKWPRRFGKAQTRLDSVGQDIWRKLAKKHRLGVYDLMWSIRIGRVERTKVQKGVGFKRGGFTSWEGIAAQVRFLRKQIGDEWRDWTPEEKAFVYELILPVIEFGRQLRSGKRNDLA